MRTTIGISDYRVACELLARDVDDGLSPAARVSHVPEWLIAELIATEAARHKLRAWAQAGARDIADPAEILTKLDAYGDPILPHLVARTLAKLPPPVRVYALDHVTFLLVGAAFGGWCGPRPALAKPWLVVISARDGVQATEALIAHETGHAWLMKAPESTALDLDERQVDALMRAWGFANVC
jgi:hypothetical protein